MYHIMSVFAAKERVRHTHTHTHTERERERQRDRKEAERGRENRGSINTIMINTDSRWLCERGCDWVARETDSSSCHTWKCKESLDSS